MSIATQLQRIKQAKEALKQAINAKGGTLTDEKLDAYAEAVSGLSTSGEKFYKCASVDGGTWSGYKALIDGETGVWSFSEEVTSGLSYNKTIPQVGKVYDENCTFMVSGFDDGVPTDGLKLWIIGDDILDSSGNQTIQTSGTLAIESKNGLNGIKFNGSSYLTLDYNKSPKAAHSKTVSFKMFFDKDWWLDHSTEALSGNVWYIGNRNSGSQNETENIVYYPERDGQPWYLWNWFCSDSNWIHFTPNLDDWNTIIITYDYETLVTKYYCNGVLLSTTTQTKKISENGGDFYIGRGLNTGNLLNHVWLRNIRFYDRVLDDSGITALSNEA